MSYEDAPLEEVMKISASDPESLLKVRAWEVDESPEELGYKHVKNWPKLPPDWSWGQVVGVAVDQDLNYYVYHRGDKAPSLVVFNRDGDVLRSWGNGIYGRPHMIKCDSAGNIWLIDDGSHILYLYNGDGDVLKKLGTKDVAGMDGTHFNRPTDIAFGLDGGYYISDGYGNRRVARFDSELNYLGQWGSEGEGEGQFVLPHAITADDEGLVYVADRTKWRVQIFSSDGEFLRQWTHIGKPYSIVYADDGYFYICDGDNDRVTKVDKSGRIIGFFGEKGSTPGGLATAHDITVAKNGDILTAHLDGRVQLFTLI
jgi:DNA-binding beta-propeller fold protein YncE